MGPTSTSCRGSGPAIIWIEALLATLLGLDRLFQDDRDDGALDLLFLAGQPMELVVLARPPAIGSRPACRSPSPLRSSACSWASNHWGLTATTLTLLVGTPALTLVGTVGAALAAAFGRGGILIAVLVLPFTIPVLIFGVSAATAAVTEPQPFLPPFLDPHVH